ncbi:GDP-L-fucose synthetase (EC 1.1.1.271) [uncultured Gammaproteobacteria bacterium]|uniref:GDP-L-fucose synthase n=1 Tax=Bathymodiolus azoricus thioautotrophic gill symbiont TaxID=235205 RepID=A0A1H6M5L0_9GAMM|nr:GDP-L-fucose synthase [Bathymodiolus azoricus thioautotrophic gill symbiont]CAC9500132.1 GDP-L-fucose synthetase (EC 1.1.1.271) [uncultured Gammaproteobacteria bacterium]CAC9507624.1 GDP-L-fucose synthetase (EC 1.1.1.271) [uncultured Gammaproteobacteria bacterium]CAC9981036.1 GDP-L-fucose synthetase (EC 1.1.1.271) [uncultured Gammaproteobacteria bacterium]CAC9983292.1 GDP-L-fucose synthetase (EC 1.1.1.271) [uncultured Gammaproteobacteria bacterium]CAC9991017.1 GDP-L-fucose synthetase (EC 1.
MDKNAKIYIAGHRGLVGSAIIRKLELQGFNNLITRTHQELDLISQQQVADFFATQKPDYVILAAAKVGGIYANDTYPADFIYQNMMIEANIIHASYTTKVKRLLFLGSSCIYPKLAPQPMPEECLLTSELESTNEPYAIAKIAGIKLCESYNRQYNTDFRSVMPTNLYGEGDNFHPKNSHVIPALIRRFHEAKINNDKAVKVWGSGKAMREFLFVDDMAQACLHILMLDKADHQAATQPRLSHINIGTGEDVTIKQLAKLIKKVTDFQGDIIWDENMPDGTPRKRLNVDKIKQLGWQATTTLEEGLSKTYRWFVDNA